ncbi:DnaD domain protein, partial [Clostridium sp. HV4-5-A1G]|uniref:DnaD domain protein n=1 Tax=Clostridium sp. HV4-5-A1G TaxID=2004595 RepID=UPI00123BCCD8
LKACENSSKTTNPSVNYIQGILSSWYSKGIKTVEDIEKKDKPAEKKEYKKDYQKQKDYKVTKTRFHNFEQRSDKYTAKQLEEMARKKREGYYLKSKGD